MNNEEIFKMAIFAFVALFVVVFLFRKKAPKEKTFVCARCKCESPHTARTIEAWRNNKNRFFCNQCHFKWLDSQPKQKRETYSSSRSSGSGCLGVVIVIVTIPIGYFIFY